MRKLSIAFLALFALPFLAIAHVGEGGMTDFSIVGDGDEMMQIIEDRAVGEDVHEEMEALMTKMMTGTMTEQEAERAIFLMEEYPGPYGMMMIRMTRAGLGERSVSGTSPWGGMMHYPAAGGGIWFWFGVLAMLVWIAVGLLLIAVLWRRLAYPGK